MPDENIWCLSLIALPCEAVDIQLLTKFFKRITVLVEIILERELSIRMLEEKYKVERFHNV